MVKESAAGTTEGVSKASRATSAQLKAVGLTADVAPAAAEKQALGAARGRGSKARKAENAPRKVVWVGGGSPQLAYETVVGGLQHDGTPNRAARAHGRHHGREALRVAGRPQRHGQHAVQRPGDAGHRPLVHPDRHRARQPQDVQPEPGTSGTGTLFSGADDVWGDGTPATPRRPARTPTTAPRSPGTTSRTCTAAPASGSDGVGAYSRSTTATTTSTPSGRTAASA